MDQDRNDRRRKSEDGYSNANRSGNSYNRGYQSNGNRENNYNRGDNRPNRGGYNNGGNRSSYGRSNGNNERNYNRYDSYNGNRSYNSYDPLPYDDHPYSRGNQDNNYNRDYNRDYNQRPNNRQRYGNDYNNNDGYNNNRSYNSNDQGEPQARKKRPRIGERVSPGGAGVGNRPYGNSNRPSYRNSDRPYGNNNRSSYGNNSYRRGPGNSNRRYDQNDKYSQKKQLEYKDILTDPTQPLRLNKFLANAGVCSRREADEYIQAGVIKVNDEVVTELGHKVLRTDKIMFHDQLVSLEKKAYVLLNKPKNCVTTSSDPEERKTVMDIVRNACNERIYPVGRLDRNTTGVLLLTNDGELASKLTHPKFIKKKIYHVVLDKPLTRADMQQIADGITLDDGEIHADAISYVKEEDKKEVGIEIHIGKNRIVRRIFDHLGYKVMKLDRVYFAGLTKKNLPRGKWRYLSQKEVDMLRMGAFE